MAAVSICSRSCSSPSYCTTSGPSIRTKPTPSSVLVSSSFGGQALRHCDKVASRASGGRRQFTVRADRDGDWGARDPTTAEIESNFGDKVLGFQGTEHIKLIPPSLLGLSERSCTPLPEGTAPLSEEEANPLLRKVVGWRLAKTDQGLKIWTEWKLKDAEAGATLFDRIKAVAEAEDQQPELQLSESNIAKAEVFTRSIGGLSINDFIFAAKVDNIKTSDLVKKNKFWA